MAKKKDSSKQAGRLIAQNRKARFNYTILDTYEAGMVLKGYEIKSIRLGEVNIQEAYIRPMGSELFLVGAHIKPYACTKDREVDPLRPRKLLLKSAELNKLQGRVAQRGLTIVPLELYLKEGWAKLKIGLAKGKTAPDKRRTIQERDVKREIARSLRRS